GEGGRAVGGEFPDLGFDGLDRLLATPGVAPAPAACGPGRAEQLCPRGCRAGVLERGGQLLEPGLVLAERGVQLVRLVPALVAPCDDPADVRDDLGQIRCRGQVDGAGVGGVTGVVG